MFPRLAVAVAMTRPLRIHVPGMPYHLMSRTNDKRCLFEDEGDHLRFLEFLAASLARFDVTCLAYCIMWNHFHLLVVPQAHSVSSLMHHLNTKVCIRFNKKHRRLGHVLEGRFKSPMVDNDSYLLTALRYLALNPVVAKAAERPEDFRWSSYRALVGLEPCPPFLATDRVWRALDTDDATTGRERLVSFVNASNVSDGMYDLSRVLFVGGRQLKDRLDPLVRPHRENVEFSYMHRFATRPPLAEILDVPDEPSARDEAARVAFHQHAYKLREIGEAWGQQAATIWVWVKRAEQARIAEAARGVTSPAARPSEPREIPRVARGQTSIFE
jgi:putative transposase